MLSSFWLFVTTNPEFAALIVGTAFLVSVMFYWHLDKSVRFDLRDLLIDTSTKQLSLYKCGQLVALLVSTWILINETRSSRLTDWLFTAYMLSWAGANSLNKFLEQRNGSTHTSTMISTSSSVVEPETKDK